MGGATAEFPSLHHAFFVGDILIKRDCRLLQNLAPNVRIVNMFGELESFVYEYLDIQILIRKKAPLRRKEQSATMRYLHAWKTLVILIRWVM